jgi:flavin reductase (DIM6/NTAB) family NADH-FMN oxidoreductase RutF
MLASWWTWQKLSIFPFVLVALGDVVVVKGRVRFPPLALPVCLVGANVDGKPNFEAIAWFTFLESQPLMIGVTSDKQHYTNRGIRENECFSVNVPSVGMVEATDFCGLFSGSEVDKSGVFSVFYGELGNAPMIAECPVAMECRLVRTVEFVRNEFLVGEVVAVYVEDSCLDGKECDLRKVDPLLYEGGSPARYWKLGERVARAFEAGKNYRPRPKKE